MDAKVIKDFADKTDPKRTIYHAGDMYKADAERISELVKKGFVEVIAKKETVDKVDEKQDAKKATKATRKPAKK